MLYGSLEGRGTWGRMDTCVAESLHCPPDTITTLLISYTPIQNKNLKKKKPSSKNLQSMLEKVKVTQSCLTLCDPMGWRE